MLSGILLVGLSCLAEGASLSSGTVIPASAASSSSLSHGELGRSTKKASEPERLQEPHQIEASATSTSKTIASEDLLFGPGELTKSPVLQLSDPFAITLRLITSLAIVIALVFALGWLLKRRSGLYRSVFGRTLGILPLDNRRFIYLVDVMGRILVLGVTEQQINLLCEISDKATIDALHIQTNSVATPGLERIFGFLRRGKVQNSEESDESPDEDENRPSEFSARNQSAQAQIKQLEKLIFQRRQEEPDVENSTAPGSNIHPQTFPAASREEFTSDGFSDTHTPTLPDRPFRGPE